VGGLESAANLVEIRHGVDPMIMAGAVKRHRTKLK